MVQFPDLPGMRFYLLFLKRKEKKQHALQITQCRVQCSLGSNSRLQKDETDILPVNKTFRAL